MKNCKKSVLLFVMFMFLTTSSLSGCAIMFPGWNGMTDIQKRQAVAIKYVQASGYFHKFNQGLLVVATALSSLDPATSTIVLVSIRAADSILSALDSAVAGYMQGTVTAEAVEQQIKAAHASIQVANEVVGSANIVSLHRFGVQPTF